MAKKNNKPYNYNKNRENKSNKSYSNKRNYNYENKNRQKALDSSNLEHTTRIRIDNERLNDFESLDTSFLEGRLEKVKGNKKIKEKLLREKKESLINLEIIKKIFLILALLCLIILVILLFVNNINRIDNNSKEIEKKENTVEKIVDDNYLFIGGIHTNDFDFSDLDYHYVKNSDKDVTTKDVLDNMRDKIYKYNPSMVFLELGMKDLIDDKSIEEIIENISKIIDGIMENRPYSKIVVESLYPIDKDKKNYDDDYDNLEISDIKEFNKKIKDLCKEKKVQYLDVYEILNVDDKLSDVYSEDGFNLNKEAYDEILKEIKRIVG